MSERPIFTISLQAAPDVDGHRALRALLRIALRSFGLRCIAATEQPGARDTGATRRRKPTETANVRPA